MLFETCPICGGDGQVSNSFGGGSKTCPGCHGTGRRSDESLMRDVTKTKPSHYKSAKSPDNNERNAVTREGIQLSKEVQQSSLPEAAKAKLLREIMEHEATHGRCTQTFAKKIRKQLR